MVLSRQEAEFTTSGETPLLYRRMAALRLDIEIWAHQESAMFGDLERSCAACGSRRKCALDLVLHFDDSSWLDWRDYCPNSAKLSMLVALQSFMEFDLTIDQAIDRFTCHPQGAPIETD